jgi:hypothetical protein
MLKYLNAILTDVFSNRYRFHAALIQMGIIDIDNAGEIIDAA